MTPISTSRPSRRSGAALILDRYGIDRSPGVVAGHFQQDQSGVIAKGLEAFRHGQSVVGVAAPPVHVTHALVLRRLVDEVINKRRSQEYRLRLLKVIGRIGPDEDPHTFARLALLTGDPDVDVRVAASEVLFSSRLGPPRPDWQERARKVWVF